MKRHGKAATRRKRRRENGNRSWGGLLEGREYDTKKKKEWEKRKKSKSGCPNELRVKFILSSERRN